jgi:anion-transporting  ArsA/GET3 family ATPase
MAESTSTLPFARREVILCMGPGGVGKTTTAAALALCAARSGRKVVVVTVDPALRLGQALGLDAEEAAGGVLVPVLGPGESDGGRLDALLLNSAAVFDTIVSAYATGEDAADRILSSKIYAAMRQRLGGALEYAAMARVLMLYEDGEHDLIVLDTPPTASALDFLTSPQKIRELADNPAAKLVASGGRLGIRVLGLGGSVIMRALKALGGGEFVGELGAFLQDFSDVIGEFHRRGGDFDALLRSPRTSSLVVTSGSSFAVREAIEFLSKLRDWGLRVDGVVLNRCDPPLAAIEQLPELVSSLEGAISDPDERARLLQIYATAQAQGEVTRAARQRIAELDPPTRVFVGFRQSEPPQSLDGLERFGCSLFLENKAP